jgi:LysR family transcriptional regulator, glycine cleavage system transcriptional activator
MITSLPPLSPLQAFLAVVRHSGYRGAAKELNISHAALCQQVRRLEGALGTRLFEQDGRGVRPTPAGADYAISVETAFEQISRATSLLRRRNAPQSVRVGSPSSVAVRLLLPKLELFRKSNPALELELVSPACPDDLAQDKLDALILYDNQFAAHVPQKTLLQGRLRPYAAPSLLDRFGQPDWRNLQEGLVCLGVSSDGWKDDWHAFAGQYGLSVSGASQFVWLSSPLAALQAAADGRGLALLYRELAAREVERGELRPLALPPGEPLIRRVVVSLPEDRFQNHKLRAVMRWLSSSVAESGELPGGDMDAKYG